MTKRLKKLIDSCSIVSFDIYDTLLFRACGKPEGVFELVAEENRIDPHLFLLHRVEAEKKARENSNQKEITLEQIYQEMTYMDEYDQVTLLNAEKRIEQNIVYANKDIYELYQYALKYKKVILVSDMYLNIDTIKSALKNAGVDDYSELYLSSDIGFKKSNGELFDIVLQTEKIKAGELLHIGDNIKSDFIKPKEKGIQTFLYRPGGKNHKLNKPYLSSALIERNAFFNCDDYYNFGYRFLGPLLYGYVCWINEQLRKLDIKKIFFLAREGQLIKEAFDVVTEEENYVESYIYSSRRSLAVPAIATTSNIEEFTALRPIYNRVKVRDQFEKVGLSENDFEDKPWFGKCIEKSFGDLSDNERKIIVNDLYSESQKVAGEELELLKEYLIQEGFNGKCAVVDLGWNGSMQRSLVEITKHFCMDVDITGFFLAQRDEYYKNKDYITNYGYLFNYGEVTGKENLLLNSGTNLLEILFMADHATTIKYGKEKDTVVPILGEYEYEEIYPIIRKCQSGALQYIKDSVDSKNSRVDYNYKEYCCEMYKMLEKPSSRIIELFGDINYSDLNEKEMFLAKKVSIFPLRFLLREFQFSGWKVGFLKRNLRTNRGFKLYCTLRKLFN